ncbi:MAG: L-fuculose phosphate aldolase [Methanomassiliicoccales archaeon PtaU1.Bin124]|nr:MAG: L-fuculose phosphate aldolase [Methanomassiliicoccales archaeon PtaU1.Bin124]
MSDPREEIVKYGKMMYDRKLNTGASGNISARTEKGTMFITPSGSCKGLLEADQMVEISIADGKVIGTGRPSMETPFHLAFYRNRPDVMAVVHSHPMFCTVCACGNIKVRPNLTPEGLLVLGKDVPMVSYATPGSEDLAALVQGSMASANAFLLEKHGAITLGKDLAEAYFRMETLEYMAELQYHIESDQHGIVHNKFRSLQPAEVERILKGK